MDPDVLVLPIDTVSAVLDREANQTRDARIADGLPGNIDDPALNMVIIPYNHADNHWICTAAEYLADDSRDFVLHILDSLPAKGNLLAEINFQ